VGVATSYDQKRTRKPARASGGDTWGGKVYVPEEDRLLNLDDL
jgi:hypothetical protein